MPDASKAHVLRLVDADYAPAYVVAGSRAGLVVIVDHVDRRGFAVAGTMSPIVNDAIAVIHQNGKIHVVASNAGVAGHGVGYQVVVKTQFVAAQTGAVTVGALFVDGVMQGLAHHAPLYRDVVAVVPVVDALVAGPAKRAMVYDDVAALAYFEGIDFGARQTRFNTGPNSESTDNNVVGVGNVQRPAF